MPGRGLFHRQCLRHSAFPSGRRPLRANTVADLGRSPPNLADAGATFEAVGGCCGLAGNFGFERGHYDVSVACAEQGLWPAVAGADPGTAILADGFSCRTQIEAGHLGREGMHLAELLAGMLGGAKLDQDERGRNGG